MTVLAEYLAELIHAQFEGRTPGDIPEELKFDDIFRIAKDNHMEYLFLGALLKQEGISPEWKDSLRERVMCSVVRTMTQVMELKELERRFEEKGIVNQPMKGARLKFLYPSPEMREMSDIDVLIGEDCMDKAAEELREMGYTLAQSVKHHDIYKKKPFMVVEAHRAMYDKMVDMKQYEYFSNLSRAVLRDGCQYTYDFNQEDFYVYMIAHMAKHFYAMGCGIRNLVDIYVYLNARGEHMDRSYVREELDKLGLRVFAEQMEELAYVWMEHKPNTQFHQQVFDYMLNSGIYGKDENGIWNKFSEEKMKDKDVTKLRLKFWYFFPPVSYMAEYYPWLEDRPFLLPVAWGIRFCRGIFMKKGIHKREMLHDIGQDQVKVYQNIYQKMQLRFR